MKKNPAKTIIKKTTTARKPIVAQTTEITATATIDLIALSKSKTEATKTAEIERTRKRDGQRQNRL